MLAQGTSIFANRGVRLSSYSRAGVGGDVSWAAKDPPHQALTAHAGA